MASLQETMDTILMIGNTLTINKRFIAGINALWFYDYFLTLSDEVEYAWYGRSPSIFALFIFVLATIVSNMVFGVCDKTAWLGVLYFTFATLSAQIVITLRVYAVTGNSRWICACLSLMTSVQFAFGIYLAIRFSLRPSFELPDLPLDAFRLCIFNRWRPGEIANTALSLLYDTTAFSIIVYSIRWRGLARAHGVPSLLDKIARDATTYFMVIFTSHLLLVFFEFLAPESIQLLPGSGNAVLVPLMITRLMLSLKKVATAPDSVWSFDDSPRPESFRFAHYTIGGSRLGDSVVPPEPLSSNGMSSLPEL